MTKEETLRHDLIQMLIHIAGEDAAVMKDQPMAFALAGAEVAYTMGITEGLRRANAQIAAAFKR